jgi:hypothetical protein
MRARIVLSVCAGVLCACDTGVTRIPTDKSTPLPEAGGFDARSDGSTPIDRRAAEPSGNPCQPLPAGCLCAQACNAGLCDNALCPCQAIPGAIYDRLGVTSPATGDMAKHGDVNLLLRQRRAVNAVKGLISISGPTDTSPPPQLYSLFTDDRVPTFPAVYQVEAWDWGCNCAKGYTTDPEVTLAGMATAAGEVVQAPKSGYNIGGGHTAIVLYAARNTITLKYTIEDNVVKGYTVHLSGICVEPGLQSLYDQCNAAGRQELPALKSRQPLGRALGSEIQAAIRDTGSWMDPRSRKDWWQGK